MDPIELLIARADPVTWLLLVVFIVRQSRRLTAVEYGHNLLWLGHRSPDAHEALPAVEPDGIDPGPRR